MCPVDSLGSGSLWEGERGHRATPPRPSIVHGGLLLIWPWSGASLRSAPGSGVTGTVPGLGWGRARGAGAGRCLDSLAIGHWIGPKGRPEKTWALSLRGGHRHLRLQEGVAATGHWANTCTHLTHMGGLTQDQGLLAVFCEPPEHHLLVFFHPLDVRFGLLQGLLQSPRG